MAKKIANIKQIKLSNKVKLNKKTKKIKVSKSNNENINKKKYIPKYEGILRAHILKLPEIIRQASGIVVFGRRIKSLVFTTDIAIIRNCDADAVFAVYPFTPQQAISHALIQASYIPVFCGIGGGLTKGLRTINLAKDVESQGAMGVVMNAPIPNADLKEVCKLVEIPAVITVVDENTDIQKRLGAGASIINVASGANTAKIVKKIRKKFPDLPIIASGGPNEESILETIKSGANAITYTPPSTAELFKATMSKYRDGNY